MRIELDLEFDTHIHADSNQFKSDRMKRMLVRRIAEAAAVAPKRVSITNLMRGSIIVEATIRPDHTASDYRSPSVVVERVASCVRDKATPLSSYFRAKNVELLRKGNAWGRTAQLLASGTHARNKNTGNNQTLRVHFGKVYFDDLVDFAGLKGSFANAATVSEFQNKLANELSSAVQELEPSRFRIGWPQPKGAVRRLVEGGRGAGDERGEGGIYVDVDIVDVFPTKKGKGGKVGAGGGVKRPREIANELVDGGIDGTIQGEGGGGVCAFVTRIEAAPVSTGHARYCQEIFDHYKHPKSGKLVHGYGRFTYGALQDDLIALQDRLGRLLEGVAISIVFYIFIFFNICCIARGLDRSATLPRFTPPRCCTFSQVSPTPNPRDFNFRYIRV